MNLLLPLAIGAVLLFASQSNSSSKSTTKKDEDDQILIPGVIVKPSTPKTPDVELDLGGQKESDCTINQYYDSKSKKCVDFWKPGETNELVKQELLKEALKYYNKPDLGKVYVTDLCEDKWVGDQDQLEGSWVSNPNQMKIIKTVINRLWPTIPVNALPPKKADAVWLHTIWNNVLQVYGEVICMN